MARYEPIVADVTMGPHGYWVVTVSPLPWRRFSVTVPVVGITADQARELAHTTAKYVNYGGK